MFTSNALIGIDSIAHPDFVVIAKPIRAIIFTIHEKFAIYFYFLIMLCYAGF